MTTHENLSTVEDYLHWAVKLCEPPESDSPLIYLGHGFDNVWDEMLALMLFVKKLNWDADASLLKEVLSNEQAQCFSDLLEKRLQQRIPIAYLIEEAWFLGLPFYVNNSVLIPRSPIAELIEAKFNLWFEHEAPKRILDLCTGSGCIAIACALTYEQAQVDASDLSTQALQVAAINQERYQLQNRLRLIESDLFNALADEVYDLIIANPPYVDALDMATLPPEYLHEPRLALAAGDDGLDLVNIILKEAAQHLSERGVLIVEVGNSEHALCERFPHVPFLWLEFERGGHGVFVLTRQQLQACQNYF